VVGCISLFPQSAMVLPGMVIRHQAFEGVPKRCPPEETPFVRAFLWRTCRTGDVHQASLQESRAIDHIVSCRMGDAAIDTRRILGECRTRAPVPILAPRARPLRHETRAMVAASPCMSE
jgi:hypothetical protein